MDEKRRQLGGEKNLPLDFFSEFLRKLKFTCGGNWWLLKCNGAVIVRIGPTCKAAIRDCWIAAHFIYIHKEETSGLAGIGFYHLDMDYHYKFLCVYSIQDEDKLYRKSNI